MGTKSTKSKGSRPSSRPKSRPSGKPAPKNNTATNNTQASNTTANATPVQAPSVPFGQRVRNLAETFGEDSTKFTAGVGNLAIRLPTALTGGVGRGIASLLGAGTEGQLLGSRLGQGIGAMYALSKFAESDMAKNMMSSPEEREVRVKTEERKKKEAKIRDAIMGPRAHGEGGGFSLEDLNTHDQTQDAGWREAIDGMKEDEYSQLAAESIKNNNPNKLWNAIVAKAQQSGKKINTSKPLFLPNTFTKGGKQYAYAINYDKESRNTEFIPIEIGKMPFDEESK